MAVNGKISGDPVATTTAGVAMAGTQAGGNVQVPTSLLELATADRVRFYGIGDKSDETATVNAAIASGDQGMSVVLPKGKSFYTGTEGPTNPLGVRFIGPGEVLSHYGHVASPSGPAYRDPKMRRVDTYARKYQHAIGHEHLVRLKMRIQECGVGSFQSVQGFHYGDSNTDAFGDAPGQLLTPPYRMLALFQRKWRQKSINALLFNTNRGLGGTHIGNWDPFADIGAGTHFMTFQYGVNEAILYPTFDPADYYCTTMLTKVKAVREFSTGPGAGYGSYKNLTLIGISPAACSRTGLMDARWQENIRGAHEEAVRKYGIFFYDAYAKWQDSYLQLDGLGDGMFMEDYNGEGSIHSKDMMRDWIISGLFDEMFPVSEQDLYRSNHVVNIGSNISNILASAQPTFFDEGVNIYNATSGQGWPLDGTVIVHRSVDGIVTQDNYASGGSLVKRRVGYTVSNAWQEWAGTVHTLGTGSEPVLQNGWVNFGAGTEVAAFSKGEGNGVTLYGLIKSGTVTAGTTLFTLPAGYRPSTTVYRVAMTASGTPCGISISAAGVVVAATTANATWMSLGGITFPAA